MSQSIKVLSWRDTLRDAVDVEERKEYEAVAARRPGTEGGRPGAYAEVSGAVATRMAVAAPSIFLRPEDDAPIDPQHELLLSPFPRQHPTKSHHKIGDPTQFRYSRSIFSCTAP
mmetsp:Transcript_44115/g.134351  ORF Transcript_44115/g.134351 Transcript_44115/m.134351 type:complete len:114 (-) Transcript_44115:5-346(-)